MDEVDEAIVELLEHDGRMSHPAIARAVGTSRSGAAARVQRLLGSGQVEVRGVVHPAVLGQGALAYVTLTVQGPVAPVAAWVAEREDVPFVSLPTGRQVVLVEVRAGSTQEVDRAVTDLRSHPSVRAAEVLTYVEVVRDVVGPTGDVDGDVDETDLTLLRALEEDGRASYVDLARLVRLSPAGVRRRVLRLLDDGLVRVGAIVRHSGRDRQPTMGLGLRLSGDPAPVVARLAGDREVIFLARTLGRFDLLVTLRAHAGADLAERIDRVRSLPGVEDVECWSHLHIVKETYAAVRVGGAPRS